MWCSISVALDVRHSGTLRRWTLSWAQGQPHSLWTMLTPRRFQSPWVTKAGIGKWYSSWLVKFCGNQMKSYDFEPPAESVAIEDPADSDNLSERFRIWRVRHGDVVVHCVHGDVVVHCVHGDVVVHCVYGDVVVHCVHGDVVVQCVHGDVVVHCVYGDVVVHCVYGDVVVHCVYGDVVVHCVYGDVVVHCVYGDVVVHCVYGDVVVHCV